MAAGLLVLLTQNVHGKRGENRTVFVRKNIERFFENESEIMIVVNRMRPLRPAEAFPTSRATSRTRYTPSLTSLTRCH
jgi:hypothetical protein